MNTFLSLFCLQAAMLVVLLWHPISAMSQETESLAIANTLNAFRDDWLPLHFKNTAARTFDLSIDDINYGIGHAQIDIGHCEDAIRTSTLLRNAPEFANGLLKRVVRESIKTREWACCRRALESLTPSVKERQLILFEELNAIRGASITPDGLGQCIVLSDTDAKAIQTKRCVLEYVSTGRILDATAIADQPGDLTPSELFDWRKWKTIRDRVKNVPTMDGVAALRSRTAKKLQGGAILCLALFHSQAGAPELGMSVLNELNADETDELASMRMNSTLVIATAFARAGNVTRAEAIIETLPSFRSEKHEIVFKSLIEAGLVDTGMTYARRFPSSDRVSEILLVESLPTACKNRDWGVATEISRTGSKPDLRVSMACLLATELFHAGERQRSELVLAQASRDVLSGSSNAQNVQLLAHVMRCGHELGFLHIAYSSAIKIVEHWNSSRGLNQAEKGIALAPGKVDTAIAFALIGNPQKASELALTQKVDRERRLALIACAAFVSANNDLKSIDIVLGHAQDAGLRWNCVREAGRTIARYRGVKCAHDWACHRGDCMETLHALLGVAEEMQTPECRSATP